MLVARKLTGASLWTGGDDPGFSKVLFNAIAAKMARGAVLKITNGDKQLLSGSKGD